MQWLAETCVKRPVFAVMIVMAMVVAGGTAYLQLGIDRFPRMDLPTVMVSASYPGASPDEIESEISQPIEDAVATVAGIDELRSISSEEQALLLITFGIDRDLDAATQDVRDAVGGVLNRLPVGTDPPVIRKQDTDSTPILTLAVSGPRSARELYALADRYVKDVVESAPGVGEARILGASERAVQVNIQARKLAAYQLTIMQVREALARQNADVPGGRVDVGFKELGLRTLGRVQNARDFEDLVVATVHGNPVRLRDLGEAVDGQKEVRTLSRLDGQPAVVVTIQRQAGTNTVEVIRAVKERLDRCRRLLPPDVGVEVVQDQSRYIEAAMHEVQGHLISGSILASLVVLVFMRSWRSTLIAAVAIPASIIATFAVMRALDFTLNNVTMLALVLMVGVVIDDAIVVLENVFHWVEEKGLSPREATIVGTREIGLAVLATTLSLVIVFLPVSFLSSVTGRMLYEFGLTATVAIMVSMLISFSLTPMMCSRLLQRPKRAAGAENDPAGVEPASRRGFYHWLDVGYEACLRFSLRRRWLVLAVSLAVIAANIPLYRLVRQDYIPTNVDESEFEVYITAPEGATLTSMDETMLEVEEEIRSIPGVQSTLASIGSRGIARVNVGGVNVRLIDIDQRTFSLGRLVRATLSGKPSAAFAGNFSQRDVMNEVRRRLARFKDLRVSVRNQTSLRQGAPADIDFVITGPSLTDLATYSERLAEAINQLPGIVDADTTLRLDKPQLMVDIDRERAAKLGVDVREIADTLRIAVGGDTRVSRYRDRNFDDVYDVELRLVGIDRGSSEAISQLYVRTRPTEDARARGETSGTLASGDGGSADGTLGGNGGADSVSGVGSGGGGAGPSGADGRTTLTRLDNLVSFRFENSPARIDRVDRQRMAAVRANITGDYALADRLEAVKGAAAVLGMPPEFRTRVLGRGRELERTLSDFGWTFVLSFLFMYIILAAQYEHLVHPLIILFSLPLAVPFGLLSLWLGGETLNLYSALGILVLFGVVKKASILQVDHTNQLRAAGMPTHEAILQANRDRLRPILMTTIAFVAGMLPLLIGVGPGAEERRSIAVLAVGGQTLSLLLTLLAIPVVYSLLDDLSGFLSRRFFKNHPVEAVAPAEAPAPATPMPG